MFVHGMPPWLVWTMLVPRAVFISMSLVSSLASLRGASVRIVGKVMVVVPWPILPSRPTLVLVPCTAVMKCPRLMMHNVACDTAIRLVRTWRFLCRRL